MHCSVDVILSFIMLSVLEMLSCATVCFYWLCLTHYSHYAAYCHLNCDFWLSFDCWLMFCALSHNVRDLHINPLEIVVAVTNPMPCRCPSQHCQEPYIAMYQHWITESLWCLIARYRQQNDQAQVYYRHAARLVPYNGQSTLIYCSIVH